MASNPKPVEGALRDLVARWRSKEFAKLIDLEDSRCTEDICADELEAALSAAPAPSGDTDAQQGLRSGHPFNSGYGPALSVPAAAPARDGVREAALEEAAKICESRVTDGYRHGNREAEQCAIAIRAAKEQAE